jgi:hypothetical protein
MKSPAIPARLQALAADLKKVTASREVDAAGLLWMLRRSRERLG